MNMADEEKEDLIAEFINLETELTIFELMLLFRAETGQPHVMEPIGLLLAENPQEMLARAPFLSERRLLEMARQARLYNIGLIKMNEDQMISLTEKGLGAVQWWKGCLKDIEEGLL